MMKSLNQPVPPTLVIGYLFLCVILWDILYIMQANAYGLHSSFVFFLNDGSTL